MSRFVILRVATDGIYECVGKNAKGHDTIEEATEEAHRLLREEAKPGTYHLAIFEREAVYANEITVKRSQP